MFIVSKIKVPLARFEDSKMTIKLICMPQDTISVDAEDMEDDRGAVLKRVLNKKYANKVSSGLVHKKVYEGLTSVLRADFAKYRAGHCRL